MERLLAAEVAVYVPKQKNSKRIIQAHQLMEELERCGVLTVVSHREQLRRRKRTCALSPMKHASSSNSSSLH